MRADQRVVVGRSSDPQAVTVDAVSGATVTVMVVNEIVMRAAHTVAVALGLIEDRGNVRPKPAQVRQQPAATASWSELLGNGAIRRLQLSRGQIDDASRAARPKASARPTRRTATSRSSISTAPCSTLPRWAAACSATTSTAN